MTWLNQNVLGMIRGVCHILHGGELGSSVAGGGGGGGGEWAKGVGRKIFRGADKNKSCINY